MPRLGLAEAHVSYTLGVIPFLGSVIKAPTVIMWGSSEELLECGTDPLAQLAIHTS